VIRLRHALISNGLCLAAVFSLSGCASERSSRPAFGWVRNINPFRSRAVADRDDVPPSDLLAPASSIPQPEWSPSDPSDNYYSPKAYESARPERISPPSATPAAEPGYFADDSDTATQSTSGRTQRDGRPARLKDVFENWGRRQSTEPRPTIPLDEPVALLPVDSGVQVVDFEQVEPVVLGRPDFDVSR
jgi:hypothetical protein